LIVFENFDDETKRKSPQINDLQAFKSFDNAVCDPAGNRTLLVSALPERFSKFFKQVTPRMTQHVFIVALWRLSGAGGND